MHQLLTSHRTKVKFCKMKSFIIVALALVAIATAATVVEPIPIVKSNFDQQPEGSYVFNYESADGSVRSEVGELKEALDEENKPHKVVVVRGTYSYTDVNGKPETVNYYADENGYRAEGSSIPKPTRR